LTESGEIIYSWENDNSGILSVADAKGMKQKCGIREHL
jgi:hypothetical protein